MEQRHFYNKILQTSEKYGIPTSYIVDLLTILSDGYLGNAELITKTGLSKVALSLIKKEFTEIFLPITKWTELNTHGKKLVLELIESNSQIDQTALLNFIQEIHADRPTPERNFDQFLATSETVLSRVKLMQTNCDIKGKRILLLGDDDRLSLGLGFLNTANTIDILDADPRITSTIAEKAANHRLNINIIDHNLISKLPGDLSNKYDVVFTDPPYTPDGFKLFLSRAISAIKYTNKAGRIYICYGNSDLSTEKFIEIQNIINESGLMLRTVLDKFNKYTGAESIGSTSNLYVCDFTPKTRYLISGNFDGRIYTNN